jgi:hypothetical protein
LSPLKKIMTGAAVAATLAVAGGVAAAPAQAAGFTCNVGQLRQQAQDHREKSIQLDRLADRSSGETRQQYQVLADHEMRTSEAKLDQADMCADADNESSRSFR